MEPDPVFMVGIKSELFCDLVWLWGDAWRFPVITHWKGSGGNWNPQHVFWISHGGRSSPPSSAITDPPPPLSPKKRKTQTHSSSKKHFASRENCQRKTFFLYNLHWNLTSVLFLKFEAFVSKTERCFRQLSAHQFQTELLPWRQHLSRRPADHRWAMLLLHLYLTPKIIVSTATQTKNAIKITAGQFTFRGNYPTSD